MLFAQPQQFTMAATSEHLAAFAPITWVTPYLTSPDWVVRDRNRGASPGEDPDCFCHNTMRAYDGIQQWTELYEKPPPQGKVTRTISLCKFGPGLNGFPGIVHGGALLTLMDEALAYIMVANETIEHGLEFVALDEKAWKQLHAKGRPPQEVLKGRFVTAKLDIKFLSPVLCPGVVGIEVNILENKAHKMTMRGMMRDGIGTPLLQADGLWVKIGGAPKL